MDGVGILCPGALVAALIVIEYYRFSVVSPWLYERTTRAANAANDANWADGTAWIYTLEARVDIGGETFTATSELTCAPKSFTRPLTLKNKREYRRGVWGVQAEPLSLRLPDGSRVTFPDGRDACQRLPRTSSPRGFPSPLEGTALFVYVEVAEPPGGQCSVGFEGPRRHRRAHHLCGLGRVGA